MLGDLTDFKDKHSSILTNRIVNIFSELAKLCDVVILKGNHDFIQSEEPFFEFLEKIKGITYINKPFVYDVPGDAPELFLPHTKTPREDWKKFDLNKYTHVFMHQCVIGSVGANSFEMEHGLDPKYFQNKKCKVISGDIHVPQVVLSEGKPVVEYVGTPYPVSFGDHYKGRCIFIEEDGSFHNQYLPTIQKKSIEICNPDSLRFQRVFPGDQISVKLKLSSEDYCEWLNYKKKVQDWAKEKGVLLSSVTLNSGKSQKTDAPSQTTKSSLSCPKEAILAYAHKEKVSKEIIEEGLKLI